MPFDRHAALETQLLSVLDRALGHVLCAVHYGLFPHEVEELGSRRGELLELDAEVGLSFAEAGSIYFSWTQGVGWSEFNSLAAATVSFLRPGAVTYAEADRLSAWAGFPLKAAHSCWASAMRRVSEMRTA